MADGGRREARGRRATADDPRLDFFSRAFDARRALLGPPVPVPVPNARPLDNVAACRRLLPAGHPAALGPRPPPRAAPPPARPRRDADDRGRRPRLVDEIAERAGGVGPLAPLLKAYQDKGRVRVTTRHARGVRGVAEGQRGCSGREGGGGGNALHPSRRHPVAPIRQARSAPSTPT